MKGKSSYSGYSIFSVNAIKESKFFKKCVKKIYSGKKLNAS